MAREIVNRWTDFDKLEEVVVGCADEACFPPHEPSCFGEFNDQYVKFGATMSHPFSEYLPWPTGRKLKSFVVRANKELDNLTSVLEGEGVIVKRPDRSLIQMDVKTNSPDWECPNQYCVVCPRDVVMTIGSELVEATMSKRSRFWEFRPFRPLIRDYFDRDPKMLWTAAPKPLMRDESFHLDFWKLTQEERVKRMTTNYYYCTSEREVFFDAADCNLVGDIMFVQHSMTTNVSGIRWLKRHFEPKGIEVRALHFPYDLYPSHMDCTFVSVRPGLMLTNPDRPPVPDEVKIFKQNDWKFVDVPFYSEEQEHPVFCQSSRWLSMNVFSISEKKIIVEEGEKNMISMLTDLGFDVIPVPFRGVFEFGGSLHCSTWDIRRSGGKRSFFPEREGCKADVGLESVIDRSLGQNIGSYNRVGYSTGFYTAKTDGAVDIGLQYEGTGSGHNTILTADQFHQHGSVQVMQSWETPFMHRLADALVHHLKEHRKELMAHGKISVLEIGYGLGIAATRLQEEMENLVAEFGREKVEHHVIELNDSVFENLERFAVSEARKGRATVVPHKGNWKDVVKALEGKEKFSGLLYDPFPTCKEEQHFHQLMFISDQHAGPLLHKGGALVYCNLTSLGVLIADRAGDWARVWEETQKPYLLGQKFTILGTEYVCNCFTEESISYSLFEVTKWMKRKRAEQECNYYGGAIHESCLVPICVKK